MIGQGPEYMPASSPEWCPSLVTTTVTLINGHSCEQKGHCGDSGFSCQRVRLGCVGLDWLSCPYLGHLVEAASGLWGIPGSRSSLTHPYALRCPQGVPKRVAVPPLGMACWSPAAPDPVLSSCEPKELPEQRIRWVFRVLTGQRPHPRD